MIASQPRNPVCWEAPHRGIRWTSHLASLDHATRFARKPRTGGSDGHHTWRLSTTQPGLPGSPAPGDQMDITPVASQPRNPVCWEAPHRGIRWTSHLASVAEVSGSARVCQTSVRQCCVDGGGCDRTPPVRAASFLLPTEDGRTGTTAGRCLCPVYRAWITGLGSPAPRKTTL